MSARAARAPRLVVELGEQSLSMLLGETCVARYAVSTSRRGAGQQEGSQCTPLGAHEIRAMIGAGLPPGAVLVGRRPTGETWTPQLHERYPGRDWVLTRILWLRGLEPGRNRHGAVDSMRRYIYIHGTPEIEPMGVARSHGCVRMRNDDIIDLFDRVSPGTRVDIVEGGSA